MMESISFLVRGLCESILDGEKPASRIYFNTGLKPVAQAVIII